MRWIRNYIRNAAIWVAYDFLQLSVIFTDFGDEA